MHSRRSHPVLGVLCILVVSSFLGACLEQFDPMPVRKQFHKEWENSVRPVEKIEAAGTASAPVDDTADAKNTFATVCSSCHGAAGGGDGPAGAALTPKPRNFTDAAWQGATDDARIAKVLKEGGASVGLSPLMAPLGATWTDGQMAAMIKLIRSLKK